MEGKSSADGSVHSRDGDRVKIMETGELDGSTETEAAASLHGSGYATGQRGFDPSLCTSLTVQISEFSCDGAVRLTKCSRWEE